MCQGSSHLFISFVSFFPRSQNLFRVSFNYPNHSQSHQPSIASRCYIHPKSFFVSTMSMYWVFLLILSRSNLVPDSRSILVRTILTRHYMLHYSSQSLHTKITKHLNQTRISKHLRGRFRAVCPRARDDRICHSLIISREGLILTLWTGFSDPLPVE